MIKVRLIARNELPQLLSLYRHLNPVDAPLPAEETLHFYERAGFKRGVKTGFLALPPEYLNRNSEVV